MADFPAVSSAQSIEAIKALWPEYAAQTEARLKQGAIDYGDRSFDLDGPALCDEIAQEIADINGWSFILWCRVMKVKAALLSLEARAEQAEQLRTPPANMRPVSSQQAAAPIYERMELRRYNP